MNIPDFITKYTGEFTALISALEVTTKQQQYSYSAGIAEAVNWVQQVQNEKKKIILVGNGGSAGIASHQAVDYWKNGKVRATAFNDSSLLTCVANDFSYAEVFSKPIEAFADAGDMVFCISSSGSSKNILAAAAMASSLNCKVITFSGFQKDNPLRQMGDLNFYLPSFSYGFVEILHLYIIHNILDAKLYCNDRVDIFNKNALMQ